MRKVLVVLLAILFLMPLLALVWKGVRWLVVDLTQTRPVVAGAIILVIVLLLGWLVWRYGHMPQLHIR